MLPNNKEDDTSDILMAIHPGLIRCNWMAVEESKLVYSECVKRKMHYMNIVHVWPNFNEKHHSIVL